MNVTAGRIVYYWSAYATLEQLRGTSYRAETPDAIVNGGLYKHVAIVLVDTPVHGRATLAVYTGSTSRKGSPIQRVLCDVGYSEHPKAGHWTWPTRPTEES